MQDRFAGLRLPALAQDLILALFITVMQVQGTLRRVAAEPDTVLRPLTDLGNLGFALLVVSGAVVAVRRRWPFATFVTAGFASLAYYTLDFPDGPGWLGLFVAIYTLTALGDGRRSLFAAGVGIAALSTIWLVAATDLEPRDAIGWVFFRIGASIMSAALGESVRSRRVIAAKALERAESAERTREEEARARVDAERLRIAREVHDTVAHAIAIINVQAGVTAYVLDKRPELARETLRTIEQMSSQALREMRAILGMLRDSSEGRVPPPGLAEIDDLTAKARDAGLDINLEVTSPTSPPPSAVSNAAYRILQESITNVIRHVGPTRVNVVLDYGIDALEVRVTNEARRRDGADARMALHAAVAPGSGTADPAEPGCGIFGMRERCLLLGGDLAAEALPDGGFEVKARLPLAPAGTAHR
ncbi:sensor histidine kinase [Micromonospora sagamiensis]|uniref:histidine kinase n=1 Tax=Micromonospora sagamiensis TaxID=47875 RepID=A0A562WBK3_9ACTN|nr:sensor histidine kinase [Micromonospora sagamiensis]TWJ27659.1 signal transduction histidine kinase [Micromonospora sagamiensis]BCL13455.1 two-component sensor histidine kinase [Micromonospora sagamiensis]